ncbi:hypothetical protein PMAYCL1PPCAC_21010, partial [Pristionchus mayeri]
CFLVVNRKNLVVEGIKAEDAPLDSMIIEPVLNLGQHLDHPSIVVTLFDTESFTGPTSGDGELGGYRHAGEEAEMKKG